MSDATSSRPDAAMRDAKKEMLARLLAAEGLGASAGTIPRRRAGAAPPLSFAQEVVWLLDRATPGLTAYNSVVAYRLSGGLDVAALGRAMDRLVARHEALRTRFVAHGERAVQLVDPSGPSGFRVEDVRALPAADRESTARRMLADAARTSFDLERDHLFRPLLVRVSDDEWFLLLLAHHIICDAWSFGVMVRDLAALYSAEVSGRESALPEQALQFADVASWEREELQGERLRERLGYWRDKLASAPVELAIPTDRPRQAVPSFAGGEASRLLPRAQVDQLRALAAANHATIYMVLLAAYQSVLHRWSGQDDVVTGSAIAGRTRSETEGIVGYFSGALPLRTTFVAGDSFRNLLSRVRSTVLEALEHQDVPIEALTSELQEQGRSGHAGLFQAVLTMQETIGNTLVLAGVESALLPVPAVATKFDLTLLPTERADGLELLLWYRTELFDAGTADRLLAHLEAFLTAVVSDPQRAIDAVPLLSAEERDSLAGWNATSKLLGSPATMATLISLAAGRHPDAPAIVAGGVTLSWSELRRRASQLARALQQRGVGPDMVVGLAVERSADLIVGMLGILWSGGAYVPLLPELPAARLKQQLTRSGAQLVVTVAAHRSRLPEGTSTLCLDSDVGLLATLPDTPPACAATPSSLAYVLFTSGSTGEPKGVAVTHANLVHYTRAIADRLGLDLTGMDGSARWHAATVSTLAADLGHTSVFPMLASGGVLHVIPSDVGLDPGRFQEYVAQHPLDLLKITPSHLQALLGSEVTAAHLPRRWLVLGGEACPWSLVHAVRSAGACRVLNHYGPTETTVGATTFEVVGTDVESLATATVPIGRPLPNVTAHVLDRHQQLVAVGLPGELWIGGEGVAQGYLGATELTAERFVTIRGERCYRTGDRVRRLPTGDLEFLGRLDTQVKVRGHRVELAEIESVLLGDAGLRQAVVLLERETLVGYVVAAGAVTDAQLVERLSSALPDYMVPSVWVRLERFPLTANGKVDRAALPALRPEMTDGTPASAAPEGEGEGQLAAIWAEVLKREKVGRIENFFALGGNSLLAIRLLGKIAKQFGVKLSLRTLFEHPTIADLARALNPAHPLEAPLAAIWADVLKREQVKPDDNFFALGGHSLLAIRLLGRVSKEFGVRLALRTLFEHPTIAELAPAIDAARAATAG